MIYGAERAKDVCFEKTSNLENKGEAKWALIETSSGGRTFEASTNFENKGEAAVHLRLR